MASDEELFQTRWELLEARQWEAYQPHPTDPEEYGDPIYGFTCKVLPSSRPEVQYLSFEEALLDGWEPLQVDPPVRSERGNSQTKWFKRSYDEFVFRD